MNLAYVTETVIGLALVSIGVGWFVAGLAYLATRTNDRRPPRTPKEARPEPAPPQPVRSRVPAPRAPRPDVGATPRPHRLSRRAGDDAPWLLTFPTRIPPRMRQSRT